MKSSKYFLGLGTTIFGVMFAVLLVAIVALFRSADQGGAKVAGDLRLTPILNSVQEQLHTADSVEQVKSILKPFAGLGGSNDELQKLYTPLLTHFANKPKEAEPKVLLAKKRDLLEMSLNDFRKEVPNGDIRVRLVLSNLLYDTQNSLLNETPEVEDVYLRRVHEKMNALKSLAEGTPTLRPRVEAMEAAVGSYENAFQAHRNWNEQRKEILQKADRGMERLAHELKASNEGGLDNSRRAFFYTSALAVIASLFCLVLLFFGPRLIDRKFEYKATLLLRYLKQFGQEKNDYMPASQVDALQKDGDWGKVIAGIQKTEADFIKTYQMQFAVSKTMQLPYFVFGRDRVALHSNKAAKELFGLNDLQENITLDDLIKEDKVRFSASEDGKGMVGLVHSSFSIPKDDIFEFQLKRGNDWCPVEMFSNTIATGPLTGGRLYVIREIRNESSRIENAVHKQLEFTRDLVHKVTHGYPLDAESYGEQTTAVRKMIEDLTNMKLKTDERETLWFSEVAALTDQIKRQREILQRLGLDIVLMRDRHEELNTLFSQLQDTESHVHKEISSVEGNLSTWSANRKRLESDLHTHAHILRRVKAYEEAVRSSTKAIKEMLQDFQQDFISIENFREEAKLHAINLSFAGSGTTSAPELAAKARAYVDKLDSFCEFGRKISDRLSALVQAHPGGALLPQLDSAEIDVSLITGLQEEHAKLRASLEKWRLNGEKLLSGGVKALELLAVVDRAGQSAHQLGETSVLINEQAEVNLARWQ